MKCYVWPTTLLCLAHLAWGIVCQAQSPAFRSVPTYPMPVAIGRPTTIPTERPTPSIHRTPLPGEGEIVQVNYTPAATLDPIPIASASRSMEIAPSRSWPVASSEIGGSEFASERSTVHVRTVIVPAGARISEDEMLVPVPRPAPAARPLPMGPPVASSPPAAPSGLSAPPVLISEPGGYPPLPAGSAATAVPPRGLIQNLWPLVGDAGCGEVPCTAPDLCCPSAPLDDCCWYDPEHRRFYARGEYLLWWVNGFAIPPLVSTGPVNQPPGQFIVTQDLFADSVDRGAMSGARFSFGYWFDCEHAVEVSGFFLVPPTEDALFRGSQFPFLTRTFFSPQRGILLGELVNFPGEVAGDVSVRSGMSLWGLEGNLRCNLCCWDATECDSPRKGYRVDALFGPRYLDLSEDLTIREELLGLPTNSAEVPPASGIFPFRNQQITVEDRFSTRNQFYGGQIGLDAEWRHGRWTLGTRAKLGLGVTQQRIEIAGNSRYVSLLDGTVRDFRGGLLALDSNIGKYSQEKFSFVPELTVTLGYNILDHVRIYGGYNLLYWSNVARPGEQIDPTLDEARIPNFNTGGFTPLNPARPVPQLRSSDIFMQGLTLGVEVRY